MVNGSCVQDATCFGCDGAKLVMHGLSLQQNLCDLVLFLCSPESYMVLQLKMYLGFVLLVSG